MKSNEYLTYLLHKRRTSLQNTSFTDMDPSANPTSLPGDLEAVFSDYAGNNLALLTAFMPVCDHVHADRIQPRNPRTRVCKLL